MGLFFFPFIVKKREGKRVRGLEERLREGTGGKAGGLEEVR